MFDWLLASVDPTRVHDVGSVIAWHGRFMVAAWGFLLPLGVLIARFFKIWPRQNWPESVDHKLWWYGHLTLQYAGGVLMLIGLWLIVPFGQFRGLQHAHGLFGYAVLALGLFQFLAGWLRGSKGGPAEPELRGDHYDMTPRRVAFERAHKALGYLALMLGIAAIATGLWQANAPRWMVLGLLAWWVCLVAAFVVLQRRGRAFDTYQAIWGPDLRHPGNHRKPIGWGIRRVDATQGE